MSSSSHFQVCSSPVCVCVGGRLVGVGSITSAWATWSPAVFYRYTDMCEDNWEYRSFHRFVASCGDIWAQGKKKKNQK